MTGQSRNGIHLRSGLCESDLRSIGELQDECNRFEDLHMKLNWMRLNERPRDQVNDFLWFEGDRLAGFLGLYQFIPSEIELSGMVRPDHRRQGIFRQLYLAAKEEAANRGASQLLLICERKSPASVPFAKSVGGEYRFSEFKMEWQKDHFHPGGESQSHVVLRMAGPEDAREIARQNHIFFGIPIPPENSLEPSRQSTESEPGRAAILAYVDGRLIGKVHIHVQNGEGWIAGLGVLPEFRRRGYGRENFRLALERLISRNPDKIALEVATENDNALSLYQSCGFQVITGYDYYALEPLDSALDGDNA